MYKQLNDFLINKHISFVQQMLSGKYSVQNQDRRTRVASQELLDLPYNCIGLLKTVSTSGGNLQSKTGNGFLVSHFLVVTSASLLITQSKNYEVESLIPVSFTLHDRTGSKRQYKIEDCKVSPRYLQIFKYLCKLNLNIQKENNPIAKKKITDQIMALSQEKYRHDFAVLKLSQRARRSQLLKMIFKMDTPSFLTVTGYSSSNKEGPVLVTHSNKISQIRNGVIYYDIEAKDDQIGSPAYLGDYDNKVIGIHCGLDPKTQLKCATMITYDFIQTLEEWSSLLKAPFPFLVMNKKQNKNYDDQIYQDQLCFKGEDRRKEVEANDATKYPFDCIGLLEGRNRLKIPVNGTGFLISDCFVLTSAHTIHQIIFKNTFDIIPLTFEMIGIQKPFQVIDFRMHPRFADTKNQVANLQRIIHQLDESKDKIQITKLKKQIKDLTRDQTQFDFALLKLKEKISRSQYFQVHSDFDHSGDLQLTVSGYDSKTYKFMTHFGKIDDVRKGAIFYDIDTIGGQSGSPVYLKDESTKVVGIHKAGSMEDKMNFSTLITKEVVTVLKKWSVQMNPYFKVNRKSK